MKAVATIDVSHLPSAAMDHRSPIWWGNTLLLLIESTMFAILIACYFYYRVIDFHYWPPPQPNSLPVQFHPVPRLLISTINLAVLILSLIPATISNGGCRRNRERTVRIALLLTILFGVAAAVLRFYEFPGLRFRWNDNAYAGTIWLLLGLHLGHIITATCENSIMFAWILAHGMDYKHARDIRVTGLYWYWVVAVGVLLYGLIYIAPRFL